MSKIFSNKIPLLLNIFVLYMSCLKNLRPPDVAQCLQTPDTTEKHTFFLTDSSTDVTYMYFAGYSIEN